MYIREGVAKGKHVHIRELRGARIPDESIPAPRELHPAWEGHGGNELCVLRPFQPPGQWGNV